MPAPLVVVLVDIVLERSGLQCWVARRYAWRLPVIATVMRATGAENVLVPGFQVDAMPYISRVPYTLQAADFGLLCEKEQPSENESTSPRLSVKWFRIHVVGPTVMVLCNIDQPMVDRDVP